MIRLVLALFLCAGLAPPAVALEAIYVVRHAEKLEGWPAAREASPLQPLSDAGRDRAQRLAGALRDAGIVAVYTSQTTRSVATGLPLATATGAALEVAPATVDRAALATWWAQLVERHRGDRAVLVVGHSNTVPWLLEAAGMVEGCWQELGVAPNAQHGALIEGYGGVWRIDPARPGCAGIERLAHP